MRCSIWCGDRARRAWSAALVGTAKFSSLHGLITPVAVAKSTISCGEPLLDVVLSHQSGIQSAEVRIDGALMTLASGSTDGVAGFSVALPGLTDAAMPAKTMSVDVKLDLPGMESFSLLPVAMTPR